MTLEISNVDVGCVEKAEILIDLHHIASAESRKLWFRTVVNEV